MTHLTQEQMILLRSKLLNEKQGLVQNLISEEATLSETHSYVQDLGEMAFGQFGKEMILTLSTQERKTLKSIDTALSRMVLGNYGLCKTCQDKIQYERLEILPFTDVCSSHN